MLLDEEGATGLLRRLDVESPAPAPDATRLDVGSRPAAAAARDGLMHLVPPARRGAGDLGGRAPL